MHEFKAWIMICRNIKQFEIELTGLNRNSSFYVEQKEMVGNPVTIIII